MTSKPALTKRLDGYWKMELGNVWLLPVCMVWAAYFLEYPLGWLSWTSMVPMCGLLLLGGLYWRAKLRLLQGQHQQLAILLPWARSLQWPFAIASAIVCALCLASWMTGEFALSLGDRITASIAASLAMLEYVNYYHRQLQHFDHAADWKRLLAGRGFRVSQMAADLQRLRQKR